MVQVASLAFPVIKNHQRAGNRLFKSMRRLSSGQRITQPGDAPADYGVSQNLRFQIKNATIARRNVENINDLLRTTDSWLQVGSDILKRMSELAVGAIDGSKSDEDRDKLNKEYLQLKTELSRISQDARFNGVQIAGRDQLLTYDNDRETFLFSQMDGKESYPLSVKVLSGLSSENNKDFLFNASKDFTLSKDGRSIYYVDSNNNLSRYNIEEGTLERDTTDSESKEMDVDDEGRLWYATETSTGSGVYSLRQHDLDSWSIDTRIVGTTDITDMADTVFSVYRNRVYYRQATTNNIISRDVLNLSDVKVELDSASFNLNTTAGQYTISEQGLYVLDVPTAGEIRMINMETKLDDQFATGASNISDMKISVDSNVVLFNDTTEKAIYSLEVEEGNQPRFSSIKKIHNASGSNGFSGVSLDGGSHRGRFRVHNGPHPLQDAFFQGADLRITALGVTRTSVGTLEDAASALAELKEAREIVQNQRAIVGAAENRFGFSYEALVRYADNIAMADSRIRDVDMPEEISKMANERVVYEGANSLIVQANDLVRVALRLLGAS